MAFKTSNIINISDARTEKKIKKKIEVLLEEFIDADGADKSSRPCVIETIDGTFHKTQLNYFDDRGIFCSRQRGHCEFFDYISVKNIF